MKPGSLITSAISFVGTEPALLFFAFEISFSCFPDNCQYRQAEMLTNLFQVLRPALKDSATNHFCKSAHTYGTIRKIQTNQSLFSSLRCSPN